MRYFIQQIEKAKLKQSIVIMIISLIFNAYFLGTYFMSQKDFTTLINGLNANEIILLRKACVENVIHAI